jgi:hypothetical protein
VEARSRNNFWQFVAKIKNNGAGVDVSVNPSGVCGTVLLSAHQLVSFTGVGTNSQGQLLAVNPNLSEPFSPVFNPIDFSRERRRLKRWIG